MPGLGLGLGLQVGRGGGALGSPATLAAWRKAILAFCTDTYCINTVFS